MFCMKSLTANFCSPFEFKQIVMRSTSCVMHLLEYQLDLGETRNPLAHLPHMIVRNLLEDEQRTCIEIMKTRKFYLRTKVNVWTV